MENYTSLRNLFRDLTFNSTSDNLTLGDTLINASIKRILGLKSWPFLLKTNTQTTVASQQFYNLPYNFGKLAGSGVTVTVSNTRYAPKEAPNVEFWNQKNESTTITSNIPEWFFILNGQLGFWPTPSSAGNTITYTYKVRFKDLSRANYTTGNVGTATLGSATITGSAASWATVMAGRWIRITAGDTANTGDGEWYEIDSISSSTAILKRNYAGLSIAGVNNAYIIGETSPLPEGYDDIPVYEAAAIRMARLDPSLAIQYKAIADEKLLGLVREYSSLTGGVALDESEYDATRINPNFFVQL